MAIAVVFGITGLLAFPGAMGFRFRMIRLKSAELVLFLAMAAIGIIGYGDKFSPTNNPPNGLNRPMMMMFNPKPPGSTVTEADVARGFSVVSVGTNEVFDFTMPTDGVRVAKWWLRGGSNDKAFVPGGIAMIGGEILDKLPRPTARYCPLKATSLLVAGESEFWHQQTVSNSMVYTWKDAYLLRNLSLPFSMQAEIFGNGDFEYRYDLSRISNMGALTNVVIGAKFGANELGDVSALLDGTNVLSSVRFCRLSEFDWDGDGLANEIDPEPYASNGDCFGTGEGWLAANFAVCLATNANPGAYYELEFTATSDVTLELYFVNRIARGVNADYDKYGIVVSTNALVKTVAHEIGHGFGCYDVFDVKKDNRSVHLQDSSVCCQHAPKDSSNGSGCRYYLPGIVQDAIIQRVLMYGFGAPDARDIPSGFIHGFASDGGEGLVDVGFFRDGTRRVLRLHQ